MMNHNEESVGSVSPLEAEKPKVFITQVPNRRDPATKVLSPSVNISPASEHGEIQIMMPPEASFYATADLVTQMRAGLRDYRFTRGDALVALGDPVIIAVAGALLHEKTQAFNILRWDRGLGRYVKIRVVI